MIKVSDAVLNQIRQDPAAHEAMKRGILNFSAYANSIQEKIEQATHKAVQVNTIIVALSRMAKFADSIKPLHVEVTVDSLNISSPLRDISFEKTIELQENVAEFVSGLEPDSKFIAVTSGITEITVICSEELADRLLAQTQHPPKASISNLAAITVSFSDKYIPIPNTVYSLLTPLAVNSVNIIEIVSTYTEITFVIYQEELDIAVSALKPLMRSGGGH